MFLHIANEHLERVHAAKFLWIHIDEHLTWKQHINLCRKMYPKAYIYIFHFHIITRRAFMTTTWSQHLSYVTNHRVVIANHRIVLISHHPLGIYNSAVSGLWTCNCNMQWTYSFRTITIANYSMDWNMSKQIRIQLPLECVVHREIIPI